MSLELAFFTTALDLIGKDKVRELLCELGYDNEPTPAFLMEVMDQEGKEFGMPFGKLLTEALESPVAKAKVLVAVRHSKLKGSGEGAMTDEQRANMGLSYLSSIGNTLVNGGTAVAQILRQTSGADAYEQMWKYQATLNQQENDKNQRTLYYILGGIGVLLVVVIFVVALMRK